MMLFLDGSHYPQVLEAKSLTVTDFQYIALKQMLLPRYEKVYFGCLFTRIIFHGWKEEYIQRGGWEAGQPRSNGENKLKADWNEMTNSPKGKPDTGPGLQDIAI
jgi:hypothetical protein